MSQQTINQNCPCPCGHSRFSANGNPITRLFCHCTICQSVYDKPFSDFVVFWAPAVDLPAESDVQFRRYRSPPALQRGRCVECQALVVGFLELAPFLKLAFVPSANFPDQTSLPDPSVHIFYHCRLGDALDSLPKISGYWPSELKVSNLVMGSLFRGRRHA